MYHLCGYHIIRFIHVLKMNIDEKNALAELKSLLQSTFAGGVTDVVLFGSRTHGMAGPDSDFDVLVVLKEKADWKTERAVSDICYDIELKYGIPLDTHIIGEEELITLRGKQPVYSNALSRGLRV